MKNNRSRERKGKVLWLKTFSSLLLLLSWSYVYAGNWVVNGEREKYFKINILCVTHDENYHFSHFTAFHVRIERLEAICLGISLEDTLLPMINTRVQMVMKPS